MPRRSDNRNPLIVNSGDEFTELGYPTGGTPMPTAPQGGSLSVFTKHDLHTYDNAGTFRIAGNATAGGTVVAGVVSKCIKVHYYSLETDGTFLAFFQDGALDRGTLGPMWTFNQREGAIGPFIPYPGYLFKTTAGTPLFLGTNSSLNNFACAGTLNVHVIFTDDDAS